MQRSVDRKQEERRKGRESCRLLRRLPNSRQNREIRPLSGPRVVVCCFLLALTRAKRQKADSEHKTNFFA